MAFTLNLTIYLVRIDWSDLIHDDDFEWYVADSKATRDTLWFPYKKDAIGYLKMLRQRNKDGQFKDWPDEVKIPKNSDIQKFTFKNKRSLCWWLSELWDVWEYEEKDQEVIHPYEAYLENYATSYMYPK